ncbi:flagellar basal body P-ring formation chaperone FlgA [Dyella sp.]|uniref:flagellar basal body P-ring formation chaperone FlgA n=1 Tax=Dyella sp. TaxID=1869338 RepID=UPI002ED29C19
MKPRTIAMSGNLAMAFALCGGAWLCVAPAARATQSSEGLRQIAEKTLREHFVATGNRAVVQADKLDSRLQLPDCPSSPKGSVANEARPSARMAVEISCPIAGGWHIRVPVKLQLFRNVLVTIHPLQRGDGVTAADVRSEERDITRLGYGYIDSLDQLLDRSMSRPVMANTVLTPAALGGRQTVRAGDHVQMIARISGIEVRATGTALGSGDTGARLRVRNDSSGKPVDAIVRDAGLVEALP